MILQVLVLVRLVGAGEPAVIEARYAADSVLELPAAAVRDLLGVTATTPYVSVPELERRYPDVTFEWRPRELELRITDPRGALPASQAAVLAAQRRAQSVSALAWRTISGAFGGVTADDSGRSAIDLGYTWRGRLAVQGSYYPTARRGAWAASAAPIPTVNVSASGGRGVESAAVRVSAGPAFAFASWDAPGRLGLDALATLGAVSVFASTRRTYVVTINRAGLSVQGAQGPTNKTLRLSFGPQSLLSPFSVPFIPSR